MVAEYDADGKMVNVFTKDLSLGINESEELKFSDTGVIYKVYVLDDNEGCNMISSVIEYNALN